MATTERIFCAACRSHQYLKHVGECTNWQIPIAWPAPLVPDEKRPPAAGAPAGG